MPKRKLNSRGFYPAAKVCYHHWHSLSDFLGVNICIDRLLRWTTIQLQCAHQLWRLREPLKCLVRFQSYLCYRLSQRANRTPEDAEDFLESACSQKHLGIFDFQNLWTSLQHRIVLLPRVAGMHSERACEGAAVQSSCSVNCCWGMRTETTGCGE